MVTSKNASRDEIARTSHRIKKMEVGQVKLVWTHNKPGNADYNWCCCDVVVLDALPAPNSHQNPNGTPYRARVPVRQRDIGNCSGHPWTPKVGDMVLVSFDQNDQPVIEGTLYQLPDSQRPICRSSAHPEGMTVVTYGGPEDFGAYEDLEKGYYDWALKLVQYLSPKLQSPGYYTQHPDGRGISRPVCIKYFDKTRDFMLVWECLTGKGNPDCNTCVLNGDDTGLGPDCVLCERDASGTYPAANSWLKVLSSSYEGTLDLRRRLKYHHSCGSLICLDSDFPALDQGLNDYHRGRIWIESQEYHDPCGHIHFRGKRNLSEVEYPCTPQGYGEFNLSLRSFPTKGAHLEGWGKNERKGRWDLANEEIGLVQEENDHCGTPDAHVTIRETDGIIQVHSLGEDGEIYVVAAKKVTIKACTGTEIVVNCDGSVSIKAPTKATVDTPLCEFTGDVLIDGDLHVKEDEQVDGTCSGPNNVA